MHAIGSGHKSGFLILLVYVFLAGILSTDIQADSIVMTDGRQYQSVQVESLGGDATARQFMAQMPNAPGGQAYPIATDWVQQIAFGPDSNPGSGSKATLQMADGRAFQNVTILTANRQDGGLVFQVLPPDAAPGSKPFPVSLDSIQSIQFTLAASPEAALPPGESAIPPEPGGPPPQTQMSVEEDTATDTYTSKKPNSFLMFVGLGLISVDWRPSSGASGHWSPCSVPIPVMQYSILSHRAWDSD